MARRGCLARRRFRGKLRVLLVGGFGIMRAVGPHLLEGLRASCNSLTCSGLALPPCSCASKIASTARAWRTSARLRARRKASSGSSSTFLSGPCPSFGGQAQPVEHAAHLLGNLAHDLDNPLHPLAEGDAAPLGVVLGPARNPSPCPWRGRATGCGQACSGRRSHRGHNAGPCRRGGATGRHSCRGRPGPASPEHGCGPRSCPAPCGWSRHSRGRCGRNP